MYMPMKAVVHLLITMTVLTLAALLGIWLNKPWLTGVALAAMLIYSLGWLVVISLSISEDD